MILQVGNQSFAVIKSAEEESSSSDGDVCVDMNSDEEDLKLIEENGVELSCMDEYYATMKKNKDAYDVLDDYNAQREQETHDQESARAALVAQEQDKFRDEIIKGVENAETQIAERDGEIDSLTNELKIRRDDDCECLRSIDNCCLIKRCCHTHLAHTFNKRFWKGAVCVAGIVGVGIVVVAIGVVIYYFVK